MPQDKFISMSKMKFTNQHEELRRLRPADPFEPGYDAKGFSSPERKKGLKKSPSGEIKLPYEAARERAFSNLGSYSDVEAPCLAKINGVSYQVLD